MQERMARIEELLGRLEDAPEPARSGARQVVSALLEVHRVALAGIVGRLDGNPAALRACLEDELIASVLILHDLHPDPLEVRVERALDRARAQLGASLELVSVEEGRVRVRFSSEGPLSPMRRAVEEMICQTAPDAIGVVVMDAGGRLTLPVVAEGDRR
jgi:hypothetical protein